MNDDDRFNLDNRLVKRSPRLVPEQYSFGEVPVGCGGMMLQWRDPADGFPFSLLVACMGFVQAKLDGMPVSNMLQLRPGVHELALDIQGLPDRPSPFGLALRRRGDELQMALASGWKLREGVPLEPFTGELAEVGRYGWTYQYFDAGSLLTLPPGQAVVVREIEALDARTVR